MIGKITFLRGSLVQAPVKAELPKQADTGGFNQQELSLVEPYGISDSFASPSVGGIGVSPSGIKNAGNIPIGDIQNNIPVNHFAAGQVPQSVAGSGISPSAFEKGNTFNIADPQTSLPDPHFADGKIPQSVAGSGRQPSLQQNQSAEQLPYSSDNSFEVHLQKALTAFNKFIPSSQLPVTGLGEASFYFLQNTVPPQQFQHGSPSVINSAEKNNTSFKGLPAPPFDVNLIKKDFPILQEQVNGHPLVWLDNAATTQKPKQVIDRVSYFYEHENSNIHRAAHELAARATDAYEGAREKVRRFLNASSVNEIIFVRGATEAINLLLKAGANNT